MKKIVNVIAIFLVLFLLAFTVNIYAASLDNLDVKTDKETVHPGETVTLNVAFGRDMGAYTVNVDYDENLLEYVSSQGGTANNTGSKVILTYYYNAGADSSPRNSASVTFKAKEGIITTNPTDLSITLTGLGDPDANPIDDITVPIVKNLIVEPVYVDYDIALNYTGEIIPNEEKDMEIVISSSMGKAYEKTRIIAEVTTPTNESIKLLATDSQSLEHDIIQSGWGSADGDAIGGKDVVKKIAARGIFTGYGDYSITLKLINREDSDAVIVAKTFQIAVKEKTAEVVPPAEEPEPPVAENKPQQEAPSTLPKTGNTIYLSILPIVVILVVAYVSLRKKK